MNKHGGFIKFLVLIIVSILVLSYFNISVKELAEKAETKENVSYVASLGARVWHLSVVVARRMRRMLGM